MDTGTLVNHPDFEGEGRKAFTAIKAAVPLRLVFWAYFGDANEWRLVVVTPAVVREGPRSVYATIQKAFTKEDVKLPLRLVVLAAPQEPVARFGMECERMVRPLGGGFLATGAMNVTIDPRYIYKEKAA
jgi:hypothetical protein